MSNIKISLSYRTQRLTYQILFYINHITCASVRPKVAANCRLSGFVMYFCRENLLSKPFRCKELKTALDHDLFLRVFVSEEFTVEEDEISAEK